MNNIKPWQWLVAIVLIAGVGFSLYNFSGSDGQGLLRNRQNSVPNQVRDVPIASTQSPVAVAAVPTRQQLLDEKRSLADTHFVNGNLNYEKANDRMWMFDLRCVDDNDNAKQSFTNIANNYRSIYSYLTLDVRGNETKPVNNLTANDIAELRSFVDGIRLNFTLSNIGNYVSADCLTPQIIAESMPFVRVGVSGDLEIIEARLTAIETLIDHLEQYVNSRN